MSVCQKCSKPIPDAHGRWIFVPDGLPLPPGTHFDKCQPCGNWTETEKAIVTTNVAKLLATIGSQKSGCNCAGKR